MEYGIGLRGFREILSRPAFRLLLSPVLAVVVVWASGFVLTYTSDGVAQYGLPLVWKTHLEFPGYTGPFGPTPPVSTTVYSWDVFAVDVLLYAGIGYSAQLWWRWKSASLIVLMATLSGWSA